MLKTADIISLHVGLNHSTRNMISGQEMVIMKNDSILINTSRGGIVNEQDLYLALEKGDIGGAALDVFEEEPPFNLELVHLSNLICTPHIGGNSIESVLAMGRSAINLILQNRLTV